MFWQDTDLQESWNINFVLAQTVDHWQDWMFLFHIININTSFFMPLVKTQQQHNKIVHFIVLQTFTKRSISYQRSQEKSSRSCENQHSLLKYVSHVYELIFHCWLLFKFNRTRKCLCSSLGWNEISQEKWEKTENRRSVHRIWINRSWKMCICVSVPETCEPASHWLKLWSGRLPALSFPIHSSSTHTHTHTHTTQSQS